MLYIVGGSTNAVIHLLAIANLTDVNLSLRDFQELEDIPVLTNMKPHGGLLWMIYQKLEVQVF